MTRTGVTPAAPARPRRSAFLACVLLATACASAGDRFKDGLGAEASGQYYEASMLYIDALDKDGTMVSSRERLIITGDSAVVQGLRDVSGLLGIDDPVAAGEELIAIDRLLAAAQDVGVRLPRPADYVQRRRDTFDGAITELMAYSMELQAAAEWDRGLRALNQLRSNFEPDREQRLASLEAESWLRLDWAVADESVDRFRRAFAQAGQAMAVAGAPDEVVDRARALQDRALEFGTRFVAVFPVSKVPALDRMGEEDPAALLSDILELEYWRRPPAFVAVVDPVVVRQLVRRNTRRGGALRPLPIMDEVGAEFGVLIEVDQMVRSERDLRSRERTARAQDGNDAIYFEETGTQRYDIRARVILLDRNGREIEDFFVSRNRSGSFERGVYEGDLRDLRLSRNERRLFDRGRQAQVRAALEEELITGLSRRLADALFERILRRIP